MKHGLSEKVLHTSDGVSLRDYIDLRFGEAQRAIDKAESMMNSRLEGMNEFRNALKDAAAKFITREELGSILNPMFEEIKSLRARADKADGKASALSVTITAIISVIGLILGLLRLFGGK